MSNPRFATDARTGDEPPPDISLRCWPLVQTPLSAWPLLAGAGLLAVAAGAAVDSWLMGGLIGLALLAAMWRQWLPVDWEISARGVNHAVLGWRRRIRWRDIRDVEHRPRGLLLVFDPSLTVLTPLRSLFVPAANRADVHALVQYYFTRSRHSPPGDNSASHGSAPSGRSRESAP